MHGNIVLVTLLVFLGVTHSFGYVIRRKQESGDESVIEKDLRRVENRHGAEYHRMQFPDNIPAEKTLPLASSSADPEEKQVTYNDDDNSVICRNRHNGHTMTKRDKRVFHQRLNRLMRNSTIETYLSLAGFEKTQRNAQIPGSPFHAASEPEKNKTENNYLNVLREFAMFCGLRVDKKLCENVDKVMEHIENVLIKKSTTKRCGDPDIATGVFGNENRVLNSARKRYVTAQSRWEKRKLTYRIEKSSKKTSLVVQKAQFSKAFKMWSDAAPGLEITEIDDESQGPADINIRFVSGEHGDGVPFDGKGLVVAHAFYPEQGLLHFDEDEDFSTNGEKTTVDLLSVSVHEIGHVLGLAHSSLPTSIMFPEYQPHSDNLALSQDDVQGIQNLYYPANGSRDCVDQFWCEDIVEDECVIFESQCPKKCKACPI